MSFSEEDVQAVWEKGAVVAGVDSGRYRKDACRAWMQRDQYGNRDFIFGWEIDHIIPGGSDSLSNLRPLQWENNASRQDGPLKCVITSSGKKNVKV